MSVSSTANLPACLGSSKEKIGQDYRKYTDSYFLKKKIFVSSISVKNFVFKNGIKHWLVPVGN